jgi:hypothetical protein
MSQPLFSELMPEFQQHIVTIEPYTGTSGAGQPLYGAAVALTGWLDFKRRTVRTAMTTSNAGDEVVAEASFYTDRGPTVPNESRVTMPDGSVSRVLAVLDRDGGTLPLPSHLEIVIA